MQRQPTSSATRSVILRASEISAWPNPLPLKRLSTARRASKINGKSYGGKPRTYFLGKSVAGHAGSGQREVAQHGAGRGFVYRDIRHADRHFLLIRPRMALQIIVERLVSTIEVLYFIGFFETTNRDCHAIASWPE